ncbi:MAG TPA: septum formation family protein [Trebonia sp.]|jgi:hypothetical protein
MSTEATGDGEPPAVHAVEPDEDVIAAEPTVTAVAEPPPAVPAEAVPNQAEPVEAEQVEAASAGDAVRDESGEPDEGPAGEAGEYNSDEDYEDYADDSDDSDDSVTDGDEALEYDEDYASDEAAEPRRARRWPRVLLGFGFVILGLAIVGGAVAIVGSVTHGFKKPVKITYTKSAVFSLKTGDCFDPQGQDYTLISCDSPHVAEVFGTFTLTGTTWPGDAVARATASSGCSSRLTGYLNPQLALSLASTYVYPNSVAWQAGTRTVICEVRASSGQLTGSVRGASATAS